VSGILFLAHRLPFPPDRGDKIRSHNILKALAELAPVHVGCFAEGPADLSNEGELANVARTHCMPLRRKPLVVAAVEAVARGKPVSVTAFGHARLAQWVARTVREQAIDTIYVFSGQMGQYVPADWRGRLIVDLGDVDSAKFEAYAAEAALPMRWVHAREARLVRGLESRLAARADHTLLVSEAEAELLRARLPEGTAARISAMGNGIDAAGFDPGKVVPHRELTTGGPHIVFTGQMDYPPNVDAAVRAIERLMPGIRAGHPEARFHVVGRAPVAELLACDGKNGARVWGEVPDVRPFLAGADLVLVPLTIARGVQNKVLEAMAMARPVLLTSGAATGIGARDGEHCVVADSDEALVSGALALLGDRARATQMGAAARRFVTEQLSWPAALARLPEIVGRAPAKKAGRRAA
jgi:polysaccharide biosynthesis protein PslH